MKINIWPKKWGYLVFLGALATAWGCESVAILPRDDISNRRYDRPDGDRRSDERRGDWDRADSRRDQIYGTVQDVNERRREIQIRTDEDRTTIVRYDDNTRISDDRGDVRATSLRSGDRVSVRLERSSGSEQYAGAIRVEDRRGSNSGWWR